MALYSDKVMDHFKNPRNVARSPMRTASARSATPNAAIL